MQHAPGYARNIVLVMALVGFGFGCRPASTVTTGAGGKGTGGSVSGGSTASGGAGVSGGKGGIGAGGTTSSGGSGAGGKGGAGGSSGSGGTAGSGGGSSGGAGGTSTTGGIGGSGSGGKGGSGGSAGAGGTVASNGGGGGSGGSGGQGGADSGSAPTAITGLKIDANPKNVLSAFVSWTTDKPADSVVQFGQGKYEWEISDAAQVTSHKVLIIGMYAAKAYQIKAMSSAGGKTVSATGNFTAGALPAQLPVATVTINDTTKSQPGWTLMNVQKGDGNTIPSSSYPAMAVMYDATGQPVWYYLDGTTNDYGGAISVDLTNKGVLIGPVGNSSGVTGESPREVDFAGNTLWQCADPKCSGSGGTSGAGGMSGAGGGPGELSHHAGKLSNGDYVVIRWVTATSGTTSTQSPVIEEFSPDGKKVWSWEWTKFQPVPSGLTDDWCHGNSVTIDPVKDVVYVSCRWMGLMKTSYKNPTLQWHLPASYKGSGMGNMKFSPTTSQFTDIHDPEIHDDGTVLFFDNGGWDNTFTFPPQPTTVHHSRAVEYKIDEAGKTATLVWEFPGTFTVDAWYKNDWYQPFWGDADRLANGNVLITAGERGPGAETRVFEVTKADGKVVWEFRLGPDIGVYRAERITPPLVKAITQ